MLEVRFDTQEDCPPQCYAVCQPEVKTMDAVSDAAAAYTALHELRGDAADKLHIRVQGVCGGFRDGFLLGPICMMRIDFELHEVSEPGD